MAINAYITESDVDGLIGTEWRKGKDAGRAVFLANLWLQNRGVPAALPIPDEVKLAGAELVKLASSGTLFVAKQGGVASETITADSVSISQTFTAESEVISAEMQLIEALIKPYVSAQLLAGKAKVVTLTRA